MQNLSTKQALIEEIKREILLDLGSTSGQHYPDWRLVESIKSEVLADLGMSRGQYAPPDRTLVEAVKNDVLAGLRGGMKPGTTAFANPVHFDRATVEALKAEIISQVEAEQERQAELQEQEKTQAGQLHQQPNPALVQAVKDSVMAEMQMPRQK